MERHTWPIALALGAVLLGTLAAVAAALLLPYALSVPASLVRISGDVQLAKPHQRPQPLDPAGATAVRLAVGDSLILAPHSTATLTFDLCGGRVFLQGPLTITLAESARQATLAGHLVASDRLARDFTLVLEQRGGTASYAFSGADPPLGSVALSIKLDGTEFVPSLPCWTITFTADGIPAVREHDCAPATTG
jgi:hypothetical protein